MFDSRHYVPILKWKRAEQRALQVRIVLDSLPGVAAPVGAMGGP